MFNKTRVIFVSVENGEPCAVFIDEQWGMQKGIVSSYQSMGQHGCFSMDWFLPKYKESCIILTDVGQYGELLTELEIIGYNNLEIIDALGTV